MTTVKLVEKRFRRLPLLKLQGLVKDEKETLEEFLKNFFYSYNKEFETYTVKKDYYHCGPRRNRSLQDIFGLCRYY